MGQVKVATKEEVLALAKEAEKSGRNRQLETERLETDLDPLGLNVLSVLMLHNEVEFRCSVLLKVKGSDKPVSVTLDVDPQAFEALRSPEEIQEQLGV